MFQQPRRNSFHPQRAVVHKPLVVIPTYDEAANIESIIARLRLAVPHAEVLVVDDDSPDGTAGIVDVLSRSDTHIHLMRRAAKSGLGAAYLAGFDWALARDYDAIVEMDADGSHAPEELPRLLAALADSDAVLGSRWVPGGRVVDWPRNRKLLSQAGNVYTRLALGVALRDATGGYRAYRRSVLEGVDLHTVASQGYCFQVDMAWRAIRSGFTVIEVPITFVERQNGVSKMSGGIVGEALFNVSRWGLRHRLNQVRGRSGQVGLPGRAETDRSRARSIGCHRSA